MTIDITGVSHVRLTVTDIDRSRQFYESVFGWKPAMVAPGPDASQQEKDEKWFLFGGVVYTIGDLLIGLRPVAAAGDAFDPDRVGLDHLSLAVADRATLEAAVGTLDELGVGHDGIKDGGGMPILELKDPDGNALELAAPMGS